MGLFSTLSTSQENSKDDSLALPQVLQFYTDVPAVGKTETQAYRTWSYLALHSSTTADHPSKATTVGLRKINVTEEYVAPEIGVWSCRVHRSTNAWTDTLLLQQLGTKPTTSTSESKPETPKDTSSVHHVVFSVDLSQPQKVEPSITLQQQALIRFLLARDQNNHPDLPTNAHTTLFDLRTVTFGQAPQEATTNEKDSSSSAATPEDRLVRVALLLVARAPPPSEDPTEQQTQALLQYHIQRFSALTQAQVVVVKEKGTASQSPDDPPTISPSELPAVLLDFCNDAKQWPHVELDIVENVMIRQATYPGHWDASQEPLWKILPATPDRTARVHDENQHSGDQVWLTELRDSIGTIADSIKTPPPNKKKDAPNTASTPNDAAAFFESLLK